MSFVSRKRQQTEQPTASPSGDHQALVASLVETIQALLFENDLLMAAHTEAVDAGDSKTGGWVRNLYQVALLRAYGGTGAGRATTGEVDRLIGSLSQPMEGADGQLKALLRTLVEAQGITGLKNAIVALIADNPSRDSILLLVEVADATMLKRLLHSEERKATPAQLNSAIGILTEGARMAGGEAAKLAAGVLTLAKVINGPGGLSGEIRRIAAVPRALTAGGGRVPEHTPALAPTPRPPAGGPQQPGPAGAPRAAAASASGGQGSTSAAAARTPTTQGHVPVAVAGADPSPGLADPENDVLLVDAEEDDESEQPVLSVAAFGGGISGAGGDGSGGGAAAGEPPEPDVLTADYLMELIEHFKTLNKATGRTLEKSSFRIFLRRKVAGWNWKVVPPSPEIRNREDAKGLPLSDPRCLTTEARIRAYFAELID